MNNVTIDLEDIKNKLVDKLRPSGWADKLKTFLLSSDFDKILLQLYEEKEKGRKFVPPLKTMFSAFEKCPYKDLKVIMLLQDPYHQISANGQPVADGIAMSCSNTGIAQPSLVYVQKAIYKTTYLDNPDYENLLVPQSNPDLTYLAEQGVLLINTALSVEIGKPGTHQHIWKPFIAYLLDILNSHNSGLVFAFMGKKAQEFESLIGGNHYKIETTHPAYAAYKNLSDWDSNDMFNKVNKILKGNKINEIKW